MISVTFTEFRKDASALFSIVEEGETILITRHGKTIAEILPYKGSDQKIPSWKKKHVKKTIKGKNISSVILAQRETSE